MGSLVSHQTVLVCRHEEQDLGLQLTSTLLGLAQEASRCTFTALVVRLLPALSALTAACPEGSAALDLADIFTTGDPNNPRPPPPLPLLPVHMAKL